MTLLQNPGVVHSGDFVSKARGVGGSIAFLGNGWGLAALRLPAGLGVTVWGKPH